MSNAAPNDPNIGKPLILADLKSIGARMHGALSALGLEKDSGFGYLKYVGEVNGRIFTVTAAPRTRNRYVTGDISYRQYQGLSLGVDVETPIKTWLLFFEKETKQQWLIRFLQRRQGNSEVADLSSFYDDYVVWAREPAWARRLLGNTAVTQAIREMDKVESQEMIQFAPNVCRINVTNPSLELSEAQFSDWFDQLTTIVEAAEQNPPMEEAQLNWVGRQAEQGRLPLLIAAFLIGIPILLFACCILPTAFLLFTASPQ